MPRMSVFDLRIFDEIMGTSSQKPPKYTLVVLNSPTEHVQIENYIKHATRVICADGAANFVSEITKDFLLMGDLDSCQDNVKDQIENVKQDKDEYSTDCEKCLNYILSEQKETGVKEMIICYNCWGGRMDHCLYNVYLCRKYLNIYFVDDLNICFTCIGHNRIINPEKSKYYGYFPYQNCHFETKGLVWDLNAEASWTGQVSACNFCDGTEWTMECEKEMFIIVAW